MLYDISCLPVHSSPSFVNNQMRERGTEICVTYGFCEEVAIYFALLPWLHQYTLKLFDVLLNIVAAIIFWSSCAYKDFSPMLQGMPSFVSLVSTSPFTLFWLLSVVISCPGLDVPCQGSRNGIDYKDKAVSCSEKWILTNSAVNCCNCAVYPC